MEYEFWKLNGFEKGDFPIFLRMANDIERKNINELLS